MSGGVWILCLCVSIVCGYEDVTIWQYINSQPDLTSLASYLQSSGLSEVLTYTGPYTVFAPEDDAFTALAEAMDGYSDTQIKSIIQYHIVEGFILVPMISSAQNQTTLLGETLRIEPSGQTLLVNGESRVRAAYKDTIVNNGVIQKASMILLPPADYLTAETLAQIILKDDVRFKNLFMAFMLADMINILGHSEFTVFAPVDSAFTDYLNHWFDFGNPNSELFQKVLKHHIVPGARASSDLKTGTKMFTLNGDAIEITETETGLSVSGSNIVDADIFASNGLIHAIDKILTPTDMEVADTE